MIEIGW